MSIALLFQQTTTQTQAELRDNIRQTVREATQAAEEAARQAAAAAKAAHRTTITTDGVITVPNPPVVFPGGTIQIPVRNEIPPQVEPISIAFFAMIAIIVVGLPLMRAIARKIDRSAPATSAMPREVRDQLQQISQSVDAIAIEVERISEGQRFTTKMLADKQREGTLMSPGSPAGHA